MNIHIGWPQGVLLSWYLFQVMLRFVPEPPKPVSKNAAGAVHVLIMLLILLDLYWGGFFGR